MNVRKLGLFTSVELVKAYLARIEEASEFKAVLQINPDVLDVAESLDQERTRSGSRGPLHGIPLLIKDNISTLDKLDASAGSYTLLGAKPHVESSLVTKLRRAGVIVLGKSNMSEWANFRGLNISGGWSPRGGQTLGTYYPNSIPRGRSSGSAVGVSLGLSTAALGTETWGSIMGPAEVNNVVGFKPTRGLVATDGTIPISSRQDVIGTLTRTVKDAAYLLSNMAGRSERDERTWNIPLHPIPDFTRYCEGTSFENVSIGVPRNTWEGESPRPIEASFEAALEIMRSAGARIVDSADLPAIDEFKSLNMQVKGIVRASEFRRDIRHYLQSLVTNPNNVQSVEDIIEFTKSHTEEEYPDRDTAKFEWTQAEGVDVDSSKYAEMIKQENYFGGPGGILGAMEQFNLDILTVPADQDVVNDLAAKMGFPVISVPLGFWPDDTPVQHDSRKPNLVKKGPGMPYSLLFVTKPYADDMLLKVAHAYEQLARVRENGPIPFKVPHTELRDVQIKDEKIRSSHRV
ncbi:glutamyl-tRNA amidotransferase subunit A [Pseudovirgaria hyperparasitica]|uniref:Glutamyl-tRNA amidotransferase subunit A n=1 Tax=Pseudovirgaria hyperparasitica TaxID=470096 RepID=A0A6A6WIH1_9PEZI|nr:glutamyl-tRNA amidotransferase subunit A [Pseudovirgaria hyperparasitica]KAF2762059.1 glutamyl-tRNA amidotransferase subunit A [Pseudovirgaria hyperparasitica]